MVARASTVRTFQQGLAELDQNAHLRLHTFPRYMAAVAAAAAAAGQRAPVWTAGSSSLQPQERPSQMTRGRGKPRIKMTQDEAEGGGLPLVTTAATADSVVAGSRAYRRTRGSLTAGSQSHPASAAQQAVLKEVLLDGDQEVDVDKLEETLQERNSKRRRAAAAAAVDSGGRWPPEEVEVAGKGRGIRGCSGGSGHLSAGDVVWMPWANGFWPAQVALLQLSLPHPSIQVSF
jgi:hypothetical protein